MNSDKKTSVNKKDKNEYNIELCNEPGKINLYLMRHGETIINRAHRTQGWCDGVLTQKGIEVAVNVGLGLRDIKFDAVYSSDLGRAVKTATIVINENNASGRIELQELEGLREVYFGKYEGELESVMFNDLMSYLKVKSFKEAEEKYDFQKEYCNTCALLDETNEAEDYETALKRVMTSISKICRCHSRKEGCNVLIVIHGGILRLIIDYLDKNINIREMNNSCICKLIYEDGNLQVDSVNDMTYSERGEVIRIEEEKQGIKHEA